MNTKKKLAMSIIGTFFATGVVHAEYQARISLEGIKQGVFKESVPVIDTFQINPNAITEGDSVSFSWTAKSAEKFKLIGNGSNSNLFSGNSLTLTPTGTGNFSYTLEAYNGLGEKQTAVTTLDIVKKPLINSFSATATQIGENQSTTLNWSVSNANLVQINGNTVSGNSLSVTPNESKTYTLTAQNSLGVSVSKAVNIQVAASPVISEFTGPSNVFANAPFTLRWSGESIKSYTLVSTSDNSGIAANGHVVDTQTAKTITPMVAGTYTYTLKAVNNVGVETRKSFTVVVEEEPKIISFTASSNTVSIGKSVTLNYTTTSGIEKYLINNIEVTKDTTKQKVGTEIKAINYTLAISKTVNNITKTDSKPLTITTTCTPPECLLRDGFTSADQRGTGAGKLVGNEIQNGDYGRIYTTDALLYGPYAEMKAGTYDFVFYGTSGTFTSAPEIDVYSYSKTRQQGTRYFYQKITPSTNGILASGTVTLPEINFSENAGLEIRVMNTAGSDQLVLKGYRLIPRE